MLVGSYTVVLDEPDNRCDGARVDVSKFFADGAEVVLAGVADAADWLAVWPKESSRDAVAWLDSYWGDEGSPVLPSSPRAQQRALEIASNAVRIRGGTLGLTAGHLHALALDVGDGVLMVGVDDHVELWNRRRWEEVMTSCVDDELERLTLP